MTSDEPDLAEHPLAAANDDCDQAIVAEPTPPAPSPPAALPEIENVDDLDWQLVEAAVSRTVDRSRMRTIVEGFEALLDGPQGPNLLFDQYRGDPHDQTIRVDTIDPYAPMWIIGDLHGDVLALEAALALIERSNAGTEQSRPNIAFLGDLFDDQGLGLELLLRVFELILEAPDRICVVVGNHDEALSYDGNRFASTVSPGDFADFLNANIAHEWIERAGKLAVRFFAQAPHALFLPDGLLIAHAGFPLTDLHAKLEETGDWNDPLCLSDFTWTRAHPTARKKMPNRFTRGSQFGYEDFAAFCELSARMGRLVTHLVRGHDHGEDRYFTYPQYEAHPVLTTIALSRRLPRESFGPYERVPTIARYFPGALPTLYRIHIPAGLINSVFPQPGPAPDPEPIPAAPADESQL